MFHVQIKNASLAWPDLRLGLGLARWPSGWSGVRPGKRSSLETGCETVSQEMVLMCRATWSVTCPAHYTLEVQGPLRSVHPRPVVPVSFAGTSLGR